MDFGWHGAFVYWIDAVGMNDELTFNGYTIKSLPVLADGEMKFCAIVVLENNDLFPSFTADTRDEAVNMAKDWCSEKNRAISVV